MKTSAEERKHLWVVLMGSHLYPTLEGPTRAPKLINHVIRSHRQQPTTTCNCPGPGLISEFRSEDVHGRPVAVDVPTDVGKGDLEPRALTGRVSARRAPDSGLRAPESVYLTQVPHCDGGISDLARWDSCGCPVELAGVGAGGRTA